jgi:urease accessory protein
MRPRRDATRIGAWLWAIALVLAWTRFAHAHVERGQAAGFVTGFGHPWSGFDHVLAMIAVGIWGA